MPQYNKTMVSKEQYYARKEAGLCTKCGKSREGSPSQVRCLDCHNKVVKVKDADSAEKMPNTSTFKKNTILDKQVDPKICKRCGEELPTYNLICQKCLKNTKFTKFDAIERYGNRCGVCAHTAVDDLKIVSSKIEIPMKHKDSELYRLICYRRNAPPEYMVMCHNCYWKTNMIHLKQMKTIFDRDGVFNELDDEEEDILDI